MFVVEDNINFYEEINKDEYDNDDDNKCLITYEDLKEDYVRLDCGHSFNYEPLFKDIQNHKIKFNKLERKVLSTNEIRCPYCRTIHRKLLPINEKYPTIHGVNYIDDDILLFNNSHHDYVWVQSKCDYSKEHPFSNGLCESCNNTTVTYIDKFKLFLCIQHKNEYHYNYLSQKIQLKKEQDQKIKEEKKLAKLKEKESKNNMPKCSQITKKGTECSYKSVKDGLCTKHFNMLNSNNL